jgi:hypothetical protein
VALNDNYALTYLGADLSVTPKAIAATAAGQSKIYGEDDPALTYAFAPALVGSDEFTGALTRAPGENVGTYAISRGTLALSGNYTLSFTDANLEITQRAVTVTADAQSKTYGDADPALSYQITNGSLAFSDAFTGALSRSGGENAGDYAIEQGSLALSANYALTYVGAQLAINKKTASISPAANTKVYGAPDPGLTGTPAGFLPADAVTATYNRTPGEAVTGSPYTISATLAPAGVLGNYEITYNTANFTITPAPLTVTPSDKVIIQGGLVTPLVGNVTGIQLLDDISATYSVATNGMSVGSFPITATLADPTGKLANYTLTQNTGTLTVTENAAPVITSLSAPLDPVQLGSSPVVNVTFTDVDVVQSRNYTVTIDWGNGTPVQSQTVADPGTVSFTYLYPATGVNRILVTVSDKIPGNTDSEQHEYIVIYDPSGGFVTGGGWIMSPTGACDLNAICTATTVGKATFGFNSKYQKGRTEPTGNTEFQFQAGNLTFKSTDYDWLVVSSTQKAQFRGTGSINGSGSYTFVLTAIDGDGAGVKKPDAFRIQIRDNDGGKLVYDNKRGSGETADDATTLGGGSIVIHSK